MIVIIQLIFTVILFVINIYLLYNSRKVKTPDDFLFHMSSETETIFRALNNILLYDKNFTFISINQLDDDDSYDSGIGKYNISNIVTYSKKIPSNYKPHFIQGFTEIKEGENYIAHKYSYPIDKPIKLKGINANYAYILKFKRLDGIEFYYIQITQTFGGYFNDNSYKAISELLQYIIKNFPGEYIITGDFNVQGHEKIFQHFLKDENYHICPFYKYITCNDGEGLASPDGLVVSKKLYKHIQYNIDIYPGQSYQHFMITAKLYINGPTKTECIINKKTLDYFEQIKKNTKSNNYVNNSGKFNINTHAGNISNITEMQFKTPGNTIYRNKILTNKLNTILKF